MKHVVSRGGYLPAPGSKEFQMPNYSSKEIIMMIVINK
jgi:hypothetical protein